MLAFYAQGSTVASRIITAADLKMYAEQTACFASDYHSAGSRVTHQMSESAYISAAWTFWQRDEESDRGRWGGVIEGRRRCCSKNLSWNYRKGEKIWLWIKQNWSQHVCVLFGEDDRFLILNMITFSYLVAG